MFRDCLLHSGHFCCNYFKAHHQPLSAHFADKKAEALSTVTALWHTTNKLRCWTLKSRPLTTLQGPLWRQVVWWEMKLYPRTPPSKQNSWPHFVFVLHKPLQPFIPRFPYQNSPNVHYLGAPKQKSFISIMFFSITLFKINRIFLSSEFLRVLTFWSLLF